jgi:DNA-binding transcriptional LysR family regulator
MSYMRGVHLRGIDLNLLPPLEALLRLRNVTRAAAEVGLSQPAMSRALGRLRDLVGDPLLVRAHGKLALTPKAERLLAHLAPALDGVKQIFAEKSFDPAAATRTVRIAGVDTQTVLYAPGIMARLAREAPGIDIRFEPIGGEMIARMDQGGLDFVFALATTPLPPGVISEPIARDRLALVMRAGHPWAARRWRVKDYAAVQHVGVSILGDAPSDLDAALAAHGVTRRVALVTPHFTAALAAVGATNMVTTISRTFAERFAGTFGLVLREPPLANTEMQVTLVSSHLRASDPLLGWLRGVIREVAQKEERRLTLRKVRR